APGAVPDRARDQVRGWVVRRTRQSPAPAAGAARSTTRSAAKTATASPRIRATPHRAGPAAYGRPGSRANTYPPSPPSSSREGASPFGENLDARLPTRARQHGTTGSIRTVEVFPLGSIRHG